MGRTNIKPPMRTSSKFRKPYINSEDYPDYMRIVPAQYIYSSNPNVPHSLYKKPYAEYSEDYPAMELTWNQYPIVFDWRPNWDWDFNDIPDIYTSPYIYTSPSEEGKGVMKQYIVFAEGGSASADVYRFSEPTWADAHDIATGEGVEMWDDLAIGAYKSSTGKFSIFRGFIRFDLSGISGIIKEVKLVDPFYYMDMSVQCGTQGEVINTSDYNSFIGNTFGIGILSWSGAKMTCNFNSKGIKYVRDNLGRYAYFCIRDYDFDYLNVEPPYLTWEIHKGIIHTGGVSVSDTAHLIITMIA